MVEDGAHFHKSHQGREYMGREQNCCWARLCTLGICSTLCSRLLGHTLSPHSFALPDYVLVLSRCYDWSCLETPFAQASTRSVSKAAKRKVLHPKDL